MRIIFIGVHNKPGMQPLDSRTKSGQNIDAIIAKLHDIRELHDPVKDDKGQVIAYRLRPTIIKTNLFDTDFMPEKHLFKTLIDQFFTKVKFEDHDLAVLLGVTVSALLRYESRLPYYTLIVGHPSLRFSKYTKELYINEVVKSIQSQPILYSNG